MRKKKDWHPNPWIYNGGEFTWDIGEGNHGFVYIITDTETGKKYIGKKHLYSIRKVPGKKNRVKKESDWFRYHSSNDTLKEIAKTNPQRLKREILHLCKTQR